jgi:hypothetical protein
MDLGPGGMDRGRMPMAVDDDDRGWHRGGPPERFDGPPDNRGPPPGRPTRFGPTSVPEGGDRRRFHPDDPAGSPGKRPPKRARSAERGGRGGGPRGGRGGPSPNSGGGRFDGGPMRRRAPAGPGGFSRDDRFSPDDGPGVDNGGGGHGMPDSPFGAAFFDSITDQNGSAPRLDPRRPPETQAPMPMRETLREGPGPAGRSDPPPSRGVDPGSSGGPPKPGSPTQSVSSTHTGAGKKAEDAKPSRPAARPASDRPPAKALSAPPPSYAYSQKALGLCDMETRFKGLYVPSDFTHMVNTWVEVNTLKENSLRTLFNRTLVTIDTAAGGPPLTNQSLTETGSMARRYNARVLLPLGHEATDADGGDIYKQLRFLVGKRKGNLLLPGGGWVPSLDGANPATDERVLINTVIRSVREMCQLDLSQCTKWRRLYEIHYHRPEEMVQGKQFPEQEETTVVYLCDLATVFVSPWSPRYAQLPNGSTDKLIVTLWLMCDGRRQRRRTWSRRLRWRTPGTWRRRWTWCSTRWTRPCCG